jgi:hypothetical protein
MKGVTVHAIVIQKGNMGSAMEYSRDLARTTGGSFETITAASGVPDKLKALAPRIHADHQKMATRYVLEFMGDPNLAGQLDLTAIRSGIKIGKMSNTRPF